ncbi:CheY-like chemotaxis protein/HPt (histidine-containing phosphotransfer) domain-containing protein [Dokdonella fugitiva]|uniref:CheY-like chemotaxis protein/HPt (Histidine-containing phosphotransfer) domain-containing protein n=1 Tax=Dokdonella fugitiva TaxID=328517 RepID=A0A839EWA9_9GAMM|nr:response regulator [Dokdonella fugitiva]MBA8886062.1 CheY-like chemotaxis protein/HPt (histidine-containing phosphotransfer) domain-containing protein [Dokdonella fugitiva]
MNAPRILVADDNPLSLRFLADALADAGADIGEAVDGLAAVRCANASAFDLLLLDARMPGLDGAAALARIRADEGPSRHAIALATTADDGAATAAALRECGFAAVLPKPLRIDTLREAVARHLPAGTAFAATPSRRGGSVHAVRDVDPHDDAALDDEQARRAAGGDEAIVAALRGLFVGELEALPAEVEAFAARDDREALRDRLHRLDASAGFCGVPALVAASARLRNLLDGAAWPAQGVADFLAAGERARRRLSA